MTDTRTNVFFLRTALDLESLCFLRWLQGQALVVLLLVLLLFVICYMICMFRKSTLTSILPMVHEGVQQHDVFDALHGFASTSASLNL